ncbi:protease complex subunit PrcB family protein [Caldicellulosiruptor acetigenus]|uniref:protease complex subunit PrcB family protein n=1 Tax=Caldicellulosiruptor acetigenus TaxID=301953 RepID=UPI000401F5EB|nr:protease complex subunit PrcB family protein [Caldicellulosiruptor acetigenus]WAM36922.1 protease complex subunit PrcB family protein [Caldicellulosiruptor acetigenus]
MRKVISIFVLIVMVLSISLSFAFGQDNKGITTSKLLNSDKGITYKIQGGYFYIYWGEKPTGGYVIKIKEVKFDKGILYVYYYTKSPKFTDIVTQIITYPSDKVKLLISEDTIKEVKLIDITNTEIYDKNYIRNYLPLIKGNYWVYNYKVREPSGKGQIVEKKGKIKMEVQDIHEAKDYTVVEMKGDILNLQPNSRFGFLITSNKVYWLDEADLKNVLKNINKLQQYKSLSKILGEGVRLIFEFPLYQGQKFGGDLKRNDMMYVWVVSRDGKFLGKGNKSFDKFKLEYRELADTTTIRFVPGIGIVSVAYHHNGTVDDRIIELIDYKVNYPRL